MMQCIEHMKSNGHAGWSRLIGSDRNCAFSELARNFIVTFSKIEQFINEQFRPFIATVYRPTEKVRMLNPHHLGADKTLGV